MSPTLRLSISAPARGTLRFQLATLEGEPLAGPHDVKPREQHAELWSALLDLQTHLRAMEPTNKKRRARAEALGADLAVLVGPDITAKLTEQKGKRALLIELLPSEHLDLVEVGGVPWEMLRTGGGDLLAHHLAPQIVHGKVTLEEWQQAAPYKATKPLRVLVILANAIGEDALALRREAAMLRSLYRGEIAAKRKVELDTVQYGATRAAVRRAVQAANGYDVVHLSGHGHPDAFVLEREDDGGPDPISGAELTALLTAEGGVPPRVVFLSACHSAAMVGAAELARVRRMLDELAGRAVRDDDDHDVTVGHGGLGTRMLEAGVPVIVGMRYAVGDDYACELGRRFHKALIGTAGAKPLSPAQALAESRAQRERAGDPALSRWTPVLWGTSAAQAPIEAPAGKSAGRAAALEPKPARPGWLQPVDGFVGRRLDLRSLDHDWLGPDERQAAGMDPEELEEKRARLCPIVLVTGIGGMGKTSLVAEITDTRHAEFDVVLAYRTAGDRAPVPTEWLTEIHQTLSANSHAYLEHCASAPEAPVYRPRRPDEGFERWLARRVESLCDFLRDNPVLVVMDNLETCLDPIAATSGHGYAGLQGWSVVLRMLAEGLSPKGRSRVVITSRRRPAELWDHPRVLHLPLGPLDPDEAMLSVRTSENLRALLLGPDDVERSDEQRERDLGLVAKALRASRGHPLLLGNLERIAAKAGALEKRIDGLIGREPADLVKAFSVRGDATEAAHLTGVVQDSVRELVAALSPKALELLRVLTLAEPPVGVERIEAVWAAEQEGDPVPAQIRKRLAAMPEATREQVIAQMVEKAPDERKEQVRAALLQSPAKEPEPLPPLLAELTGHALVVMETSPGREAGAAPRRALRWHELVREEAARALPSSERFDESAWLRKHGMWARARIVGALQHPTQPDVETALVAGRAAYPFFVALQDWRVVVAIVGVLSEQARSQAERREVEALAHAVLDRVPVGEPREDLLGALGAALTDSGRPNEAVPCYAEALTSAKGRGDLDNAGRLAHLLGLAHQARSAWNDASSAFDEALSFKTQIGAGYWNLAASRGERLRAEVMAGRGAAARGAIDALVVEMEALLVESRDPGWKPEPEAPFTPANGLVAALSIRLYLANVESDTSAALRLVNRQIEVGRLFGAPMESIAISIMNRGTQRKDANDLDGAEQDLLKAAGVFTQAGHRRHHATCLSSLAQIAEKRGNLERSVEIEIDSLKLKYLGDDLGDVAISHNNVSHRLTKLTRHDDACLHATAALLLHFSFRPDASVAARNLQNALAAAGPDVSPPDLVALERAFPRLLPLFAAQGLDRAAVETQLATLLAQREALASRAQHHTRRAQLIQWRGTLEVHAAGLAAGNAEAIEASSSDGFRTLLTHLGLSPDLPPAEAVATALTAVHVEIAALDAAASK